MITPTIISRLQWRAYLIFMCTNLAFIPLVYFCYPETANLTLEAVDYLFIKEGKKGVVNQLAGPSEPVRASLSLHRGQDVEKGSGAVHLEQGDEKVGFEAFGNGGEK